MRIRVCDAITNPIAESEDSFDQSLFANKAIKLILY